MTAINNAGIDQNNKPTLIGVSSVDGSTPTRVYVNPTTGRMLVDNANTSGTITINNTVISGGTTGQLLYDNAGTVGELTTATYPSLTELSYVKGVTSAIQTQINAKGAGTVTAVSVASANGVSGSSSGGATPALTIALGAITPTSVNTVVVSGSGTPTLAVTGTTTVSGSNTGDQTTVSGNSGSTNALISATTTVNVSSATAPTANQVLTATDSTHATWVTPSASITYKNGIATRAGNTASGAQTIAHGLGKTPSYVRLTGTFSGSGSGETGMSIGSYNGTTNCNTYISTGSNGSQSGSDTTNAIFITNNGGASSQAGVVTVDGTNITITWTYAATQDSALMRIMWEAQG